MKFKVWQNYKELYDEAWNSSDYEFVRKGSVMKNLSENLVFKYGVKKIESLINIEIERLSSTSSQSVLTQFKADKDILIKNFKNKVSDTVLKSSLIEQGMYPKEKELRDNATNNFLADVKEIISKYEVKIESEKSWVPFLKNVALLLTGIGTLPALASMITKAIYGKYGRFDSAIMPNFNSKTLPSQERQLKKVNNEAISEKSCSLLPSQKKQANDTNDKVIAGYSFELLSSQDKQPIEVNDGGASEKSVVPKCKPCRNNKAGDLITAKNASSSVKLIFPPRAPEGDTELDRLIFEANNNTELKVLYSYSVPTAFFANNGRKDLKQVRDDSKKSNLFS